MKVETTERETVALCSVAVLGIVTIVWGAAAARSVFRAWERFEENRPKYSGRK